MMKPAGLMDENEMPKEPLAALEKLMHVHGNNVIRTAYFYMGDQSLAEDISQEVFLRAYRNWSKFRRESSVKTWLTRITIHACKDKLGVRMYSETPLEPSQMRLSKGISAEEEVMKKLHRTELLQHVMMLPLPQQEALYLYYYQELSTSEIATAVGIAEGTVRSRLHRAREELSRILRKEGRDSE